MISSFSFYQTKCDSSEFRLYVIAEPCYRKQQRSVCFRLLDDWARSVVLNLFIAVAHFRLEDNPMALNHCKFLQTFSRTQKKKGHSVEFSEQKRSSLRRRRFFVTCQTISDGKRSSHRNAQVFAQIKLFRTKKPVFQIALWPSVKCSMAHWLRTAGLDSKLKNNNKKNDHNKQV